MALAGNDTSHYQSIVKTCGFTKIDKNVKFMLECNERLVFKLFLILVIQNINVWTHLALVGHRNSLGVSLLICIFSTIGTGRYYCKKTADWLPLFIAYSLTDVCEEFHCSHTDVPTCTGCLMFLFCFVLYQPSKLVSILCPLRRIIYQQA